MRTPPGLRRNANFPSTSEAWEIRVLNTIGHFQCPMVLGGGTALVEEQPADVVDEVHQPDPSRRSGDADGSHDETDPRLLVGEDVLDPAADLRFGVVPSPCGLRYRPSLRLLAMDPADDAVVGHEGLVDGGAINRVGPHRPRRAVLFLLSSKPSRSTAPS